MPGGPATVMSVAVGFPSIGTMLAKSTTTLKSEATIVMESCNGEEGFYRLSYDLVDRISWRLYKL